MRGQSLAVGNVGVELDIAETERSTLFVRRMLLLYCCYRDNDIASYADK